MDSQSNLPKLLARAAEGDRHAFGEFYALHLNEIYRYILFRVNNHDEAEDLTAKVFLEAWESLTSARYQVQIKNIRAWIYRIARNKVIDYHRTKRPQEPIDGNQGKKLQGAWLESELDDVFVSRKLAEGVLQLPANYQEVIILRFINQMSHAEVAEIMNITESHVRVLQYRALQQMRELVAEVHNE
ncbi:MAG TPA: RNA polymerase sigma factor [Anaerolineales bacterium]|nr:RNA polymerase sigma factor [Anaerolineales bacterium]